MPNKLVIWDVDGTLIDLRMVHYQALNTALTECDLPAIAYEDHLAKYDGLPTSQKLYMLGLTFEQMQTVKDIKQKKTLQAIDELVRPDVKLVELFHEVIAAGYMHAVCSNARLETVDKVLDKLGLTYLIAFVATPDQGHEAKPSPAMLVHLMKRSGACPRTTLIFEDAPSGLEAAHLSGAHVCQVVGELDHEQVRRAIKEDPEPYLYRYPELNILVPAAGSGQRFRDAGYESPKPFIDVDGETMLERAVNNLQVFGADLTVAVQKQHLSYIDTNTSWGMPFVEIGRPTSGAAATCLEVIKAAKYIDSEAPLVIANCDQLVDWDATSFWYLANNTKLDGIIVVFREEAHDPKWSYCEVKDGLVARVAEKEAISEWANTGIFWWRHGSDFCKYARSMIAKDVRVKGEHYLAPVFNEMIADGKKIGIFPVKAMWGLGDPPSLQAYLEHRKGKLSL